MTTLCKSKRDVAFDELSPLVVNIRAAVETVHGTAGIKFLGLDGRTPLLQKSHRDAGFVVLLAPDVPAVLIEMGFITNPQDEMALNDPIRRERLVEGVAQAIDDYLKVTGKRSGEFLFTGRRGHRSMTTRQYARLVSEWIGSVGLDPRLFGTHSLRRTKATLIYRRTGNLRAIQLLLGHSKLESTVRYLGIEVDDALAIAEQVDV